MTLLTFDCRWRYPFGTRHQIKHIRKSRIRPSSAKLAQNVKLFAIPQFDRVTFIFYFQYFNTTNILFLYLQLLLDIKILKLQETPYFMRMYNT